MKNLLTKIINLDWKVAPGRSESPIVLKENLINVYNILFNQNMSGRDNYLSHQKLFLIIIWDMIEDNWSKNIIFYSASNKNELNSFLYYMLGESYEFIPGTTSTIFQVNRFPRIILNIKNSINGEFDFKKEEEHSFTIYLSSNFREYFNGYFKIINENFLNKKNINEIIKLKESINDLKGLYEIFEYDDEISKGCDFIKSDVHDYFQKIFLANQNQIQPILDKLLREVSFPKLVRIPETYISNFFKTLVNISGYLKPDEILTYDFSSSGASIDSEDQKHLQRDGGVIVTLENYSEHNSSNELYLLANTVFSKSSSAQRALFDYEKKKIIDRISSITILVDSFAHNISAHSLSAISTFFEQRSDLLQSPLINSEHKSCKVEFDLLQDDFVKNHFATFKDEDLSIDQLIKKSKKFREFITTLLRTDEFNQSEEVKSFNIPLDHSITKFLNYISDKSEFWSGAISGETFGGTIYSLFDLLYDFIDNPLFLGTIIKSEDITKIKFKINSTEFVSVDFSIIRNVTDIESNYDFIKELDDFEKIKNQLSEIKVFIPGDNVGKHTFYTIIENVLRNIKHCDYNNVDEAIINFNINSLDDKFCSLTIYLEHHIVSNKTIDEIVKETNKSFDNGVLEKNSNEPIMGGNSQCFICARHLLTESFLTNFNNNISFIKALNVNSYFAFELKLWIGKDFCGIDEKGGINIEEENYSRFKFVITENKLEPFNGTSRFLCKSQISEYELSSIYKLWLKKFINIFNNGVSIQDSDLQYQNGPNIGQPILWGSGKNKLFFKHPSANKYESGNLYVRAHGVWRKKLCKNFELYENEIAEALLCGIVIFDNRINNIWNHPHIENNIKDIEKGLRLYIRPEKEDCLTIEKDGVSCLIKISDTNIEIDESVNFLIIHLSFIQKIFLEKYKNNNFKQFLNDIFNSIKGRDNFRLIITTGRGRTDWKTIVKHHEFSYLVAHKSPNSLKNSLLQGILKGDHFEIKYNLVKAIFGS